MYICNNTFVYYIYMCYQRRYLQMRGSFFRCCFIQWRVEAPKSSRTRTHSGQVCLIDFGGSSLRTCTQSFLTMLEPVKTGHLRGLLVDRASIAMCSASWPGEPSRRTHTYILWFRDCSHLLHNTPRVCHVRAKTDQSGWVTGVMQANIYSFVLC